MIVVMGSDPSPNLTIEAATALLETVECENDLARLFAAVENKAWWIEDSIYDYEEGTAEYYAAEETVDAWFSLSDSIKEIIFDILRAEGIRIPQTRQIEVLEPFMKRNGFYDGAGWWIEQGEQNA